MAARSKHHVMISKPELVIEMMANSGYNSELKMKK
jgi:hypothetical protein